MNIRNEHPYDNTNDYEIITYLEPEVFFILMKQIWLVNLDIFKDNDEDLSKTIAKIKTPENRGWVFYGRLLSNLMTSYTLTLLT